MEVANPQRMGEDVSLVNPTALRSDDNPSAPLHRGPIHAQQAILARAIDRPNLLPLSDITHFATQKPLNPNTSKTTHPWSNNSLHSKSG